MAMVLAPVAVAGAALVAAWWRWGPKVQEPEDGPLDDDAYWGYTGDDNSDRSGAVDRVSPMLRQQQQQQQQQTYARSQNHVADWPGSQPRGFASQSFGPPAVWPPPVQPQHPHPQLDEVEQLRVANQHLSQQLAQERQSNAVLSQGASAQELQLRQNVLELNARLLDAEDERAIEREELAAKLQKAQADREAAKAEAAAAAATAAATAAAEAQLVGSENDAADGPQHEDGQVPTPSSVRSSSASTRTAARHEIAVDEVELGLKIGEGAFGTVFKGVWRGGEVAVKQLHCVTSDEMLDEFFSEVATLSALRHPNILLFMGATTGSKSGAASSDASGTSGRLSIVSEYLCGGSLWDYLHSPTVSYSWDTAIVMAADIAKGVAHLHGEGIIHRDLK
jgi:predicted Ser/Thr protein kinase